MEQCRQIPIGAIQCDYQSTIYRHRTVATETWRKNNFPFVQQRGFNAEIPPPFFIDQYSFRSWLSETATKTSPELTSIPETDFGHLFESYDETVRTSTVGSKVLETEAPSVEDQVRRNQFLEDLFCGWQQYLAHRSIVLLTEVIDWYFSVPLLEVTEKRGRKGVRSAIGLTATN